MSVVTGFSPGLHDVVIKPRSRSSFSAPGTVFLSTPVHFTTSAEETLHTSPFEQLAKYKRISLWLDLSPVTSHAHLSAVILIACPVGALILAVSPGCHPLR